MSEVNRYEINGTFEIPETGQKLLNPKMVMESDFDRVTAERDAALAAEQTAIGAVAHGQLVIKEQQQRLTAAHKRVDVLTQCQAEPVEWGAPKTVRQLIRQLETLDQDLRPLSMLRVPGSVFEDGKERTRAVHLSFSHERVDGQWLAPFKSEGEKVLAFWCRMEQPAPVAVTLQRVLKAYEYAESHPHKYLRGTTNWCAAVAHSINSK